MDIRDKYRVKESSGSFSLQPHRQELKSLYWFFVVTVAIGVVLPGVYGEVDEGWIVLGLAIMAYLTIHGLYDYLFRINVRMTFDKASKTVYRQNPPFAQKTLMTFDEVVIFVRTENAGTWHYAVGAKKTQFVRNYAISQDFGPGKLSDILAAEYEEAILTAIYRSVEQDRQ